MQSDGYHNSADIVMGTLGGKVNDEERQFDVINNIGSNRKWSADKSETEYTKDGHVADNECLKVCKMRFAGFRNKFGRKLTLNQKEIKNIGCLEPA